ncbi:response regulator [Azospirillum thermophilum]|uniref:Response regulator n=1 Tax=Azospirillum thermophilum TaxID=2202148 RepID=A0A2S2CQ25_9PROT|nr:response regulator [Azospirillum thermophilum]AWK86535.1 response regulator [Azospirillum thermophilum]
MDMMKNEARLVVVIDDEAIILAGMEIMLESWGYQVVAAEGVEEALGALAGRGCPSVIVSDYRLRGGLSGVEAIKTLRQACGAQVPGIVLTGDTSSTLSAAITRDGLKVVHKPVKPDDLRRHIDHAIETAG